jgi:FKBP-type peptidyl-prolyl cis-trans isomerase SlyD
MVRAKSPQLPRKTAYQVGPGTVLDLAYDVFDAEGERVDGSDPDRPLSVVHGYGELLPALEQALEGMSAGQSKTVELRPNDAYGPRLKDAVLEVDRDEFPPGVEPGDRFEAENAEGAVVVLKVLDVDGERVVLDTNHPLAGQTVRFELRVLGVRPATSEEAARAEARLRGEEGPSEPPAPPLLAPERLIRDPRRRYEHLRSDDPTPSASKPNGVKS